jgi:hypothetical protein
MQAAWVSVGRVRSRAMSSGSWAIKNCARRSLARVGGISDKGRAAAGLGSGCPTATSNSAASSRRSSARTLPNCNRSPGMKASIPSIRRLLMRVALVDSRSSSRQPSGSRFRRAWRRDTDISSMTMSQSPPVPITHSSLSMAKRRVPDSRFMHKTACCMVRGICPAYSDSPKQKHTPGVKFSHLQCPGTGNGVPCLGHSVSLVRRLRPGFRHFRYLARNVLKGRHRTIQPWGPSA